MKHLIFFMWCGILLTYIHTKLDQNFLEQNLYQTNDFIELEGKWIDNNSLKDCNCPKRNVGTVDWQYDQICCTQFRLILWSIFSIIFLVFVVKFFFDQSKIKKHIKKELSNFEVNPEYTPDSDTLTSPVVTRNLDFM